MDCKKLYSCVYHNRAKWNLPLNLRASALLSKMFFFLMILHLTLSQSTVEVGTSVPNVMPFETVTTTADVLQHSTISNQVTQNNNDEPILTNCTNGTCSLQLNSNEVTVKRMLAYTSQIFNEYANGSLITEEGLKKFMTQIGFWRKVEKEDPHAGHDHGSHDSSSESHDGHDHGELTLQDLLGIDYYYDLELDNGVVISEECLDSARALLDEFSEDREGNQNGFTLSEFWLILPRLLYNLNSPFCQPESAEENQVSDDSTPQKEDRAKVWLISIASVAVISLLSIVGILIVPLMKHSVHFNRLLSFLVALAVGTLVGDGLLHLLPHAMGGGDHSGHVHTAEVVADERQKVMKSLVAVIGIYMFFVFESAMGMWRKRKQKKDNLEKKAIPTPSDTVVSPVKSSDVFFPNNTAMKETVLATEDEKPFITATNQVDDTDVHGSQDSGCSSAAGCNHIAAGDASTATWGTKCGNSTPPFPRKLDLEKTIEDDVKEKLVVPTVVIEGPHHGHHHGHSHHNHDIAKASGIKDMAWMIVMGDGLHNFSDGLAIGAAFSSSIAAGLSTSLAVFCHELPHELGDFAILLNAGMSIKQAILYNGLCACLAFIGVIIGLAIGEYTTEVKLWILAITAGGFLYVALVDMIPQMLESSLQKDGLFRFIYQNVGFLIGVMIMLIIALYEGAFHEVFSGSSGGNGGHSGHGH